MPLYNPLAVMRLRSDQGVQHKVSHAAYGKVRNNNTKNHQGWDLYAPEGTDTFAIAEGVVLWIEPNDVGDYGKQVLIQFNLIGSSDQSSSETRYAFYAHLSEVLVKSGDFVKAKQVIAKTGLTGNAKKTKNYPHLHFEIRDTSKQLGKGLVGRVDPATVLGYYLLSANSAQIGGIDDSVEMVCRASTTPLPVDRSPPLGSNGRQP
jgi:murein DD-endopeptidase MepM/ murein hydrolase activator NlpD